MSEKSKFLSTISPFDILTEEEFNSAMRSISKHEYKEDTLLYNQDYSKVKSVDIIVKGSYETFFFNEDAKKELVEICLPGMVYGGVSILLNKRKSIRTVNVKAGTVVYSMPKSIFKSLSEVNVKFSQYFTSEFGQQMLDEEYAAYVRPKKTEMSDYFELDRFFSSNVGSVEPKPILICTANTLIYRAAQMMTDNAESCLFVGNDAGELVGYVTDITLREVVIANRLDTNQTVDTIMEGPIVSVTNKTPIYEAVFLMFRKKIRYLVVMHENKVKGVVSRSRLITNKAYSPFAFIQSVKSARTTDELQAKWKEVPAMVYELLLRGVRAEVVNQVITSTSDAIAVNVIASVLEEKGKPPARFAFMALGSEGRKEQTLKTDQDNALIYEDKYDGTREEVRAYFLDFASIVSERLDYIGFSFCTGGFMAKNPKWCHSLSRWKRNYAEWVIKPAPEALMNFSTFFDSRRIYGDSTLIDELRVSVSEDMKKATSRFYFNLADNALQFEAPLTLFNSFRTIRQEDKEVINIKRAMTPIVDLVRIYALKYGIFKHNNTGERLLALYEMDVFAREEYYELLQAYYYMMAMRLKRQSKTIIRQQGEPTNFVEPKRLTKIERVTLKEVFKVIENFQLKIKMEFKGSLK